MNKIIFTLLTFFYCSFIANAQFRKGSVLLGGQLAYSQNNPKFMYYSGQYYNGNFFISAGKAINENTVFGINLTFSPTWINDYYKYDVGPLGYIQMEYGIGIFYRKYKTLGNDFFLFGEADAGYLGSSESGKDFTGKKLLSGSEFNGKIYLMPGIGYKISKKFFMELTLPYLFFAEYSSNNAIAAGQKIKSDQFTISTSLSSNPLESLGIGFRLIL